jgi:hypothetical protein
MGSRAACCLRLESLTRSAAPWPTIAAQNQSRTRPAAHDPRGADGRDLPMMHAFSDFGMGTTSWLSHAVSPSATSQILVHIGAKAAR